MKLRYLIPVVMAMIGCKPEPRHIDTLNIRYAGETVSWDLDSRHFLKGNVITPWDGKPYSGRVYGKSSDSDEGGSWLVTLKNGQVSGALRVFYPSGRPWAVLPTEPLMALPTDEGKVYGFEEFHDSTGQRAIKGAVNGKGNPEGVLTIYYPDGRLAAEGSCSNGDKQGPWVYQDTLHGIGFVRGSYANNKPVFPFEWRYGSIDSEGNEIESEDMRFFLLESLQSMILDVRCAWPETVRF